MSAVEVNVWIVVRPGIGMGTLLPRSRCTSSRTTTPFGNTIGTGIGGTYIPFVGGRRFVRKKTSVPGGMTIGLTVTVKEQLAPCAQVFVAVQLTVVVPTGK